MNKKTDILKENPQLKQMPFEVPEGYFADLKATVKSVRRGKTSNSKISFRLAVAAAFTALLAGGGFFLYNVPAGNADSDFLYYPDEVAVAILEDYCGSYAHVQEISQEDIIEYLIYMGDDIEDFEQY